jgi:hypothetical protein
MKRMMFIAGMVTLSMALTSMAVEIKTGFKGGVALSNLTGADAKTLDDSAKGVSGMVSNSISEYPRHLGMTGCVTLCVEFNDWVALFTDLSFAQKGNIWKGTADVAKIVNGQTDTVTTPFEVEHLLNYFELPILAACKPHFGAFSPFVYAGPMAGFNCYAQTTVRVDGKNVKETDIKYLVYDRKKSDFVVFDAGYMAGGGIGYTIAGYEVTLEARISGGLMNMFRRIAKDPVSKKKTVEYKDIKTSALSVMLGVLIPR